MSLLKNRYYLAVVATAALIAVYRLYTSSAVWAIILSILAPLILGIATNKFLKEHDYSND